MKHKLPFFYDYVFPTFILPNALITELGIINYLHSMYSNSSRDSSLFDIHSGDVNPLTFMFANNLGSWPNSVLFLGMLNFDAHCYTEEHLEIYKESVYFGKCIHEGRNYLYPVRLSFNLTEFSAYDVPGNVKLNGEYFWKNMSAEALADARSGRAVILLDYGQENYVHRHNFVKLHEALRNSGIPKENVVLALNTFNGEDVYNNMFTEDEQKLTVKSWPFVVTNTSYHYIVHSEQRVPVEEFENSKDYKRPNYFLYKVRRPREHRVMLLYSLASAGLLDKADWSCLSTFDLNPTEVNRFGQLTQLTLDMDKIQQLHSMIPRSLNSEANAYEDVSAWTDQHPQPYRDSYFYICSETFVHGEFKSLTEKIFKPIVNFLPFIFVAYPGALKVLRELGFKTFAPYINESYDEELDNANRIRLIHNEVARLCTMTPDQLHEWYWSMKDILLHNQQTALALYHNESLTLDFIKYLENRTTRA